jgi:hypothetical protein
VIDPELQVPIAKGSMLTRQKVINNLPGTSAFCPLVRRTPTLNRYVAAQLRKRAGDISSHTHPDLLARAAAFMMLADSKASFAIEGEILQLSASPDGVKPSPRLARFNSPAKNWSASSESSLGMQGLFLWVCGRRVGLWGNAIGPANRFPTTLAQDRKTFRPLSKAWLRSMTALLAAVAIPSLLPRGCRAMISLAQAIVTSWT